VDNERGRIPVPSLSRFSHPSGIERRKEDPSEGKTKERTLGKEFEM